MDGSTDAAGDDPLEDIIQILQHELLSESSKSRKSFAAGAKERPCDAGEEREADSTADYDRLVDRLRESHLTQHHAADDYVLRWLLGHMTGASEDSELNRRRPASWSVLQAIIEGTPLKALVKWLADLNFVPILQETLKEVSSSIIRAPAAATPEVFWPPSNPRKRKRGVAESASLEYLRTPAGCLETGSAIFEVLQTLLLPVSRDVPSDDVHHRMDVEGLKVLFLLPAERMLDLLNPMLDIFLLSFTTPSAQPPTRWFSVFNLLWDMRLQGKTDAFEAATHLTKGTCMLLDRISKHTDKNWDPLLRQFLRRTIISPAKWEFINGEGLDIFRRAAAVTTNIAATSAPILFGLAMAVADGPDKKRQYDGWVHSVFDELEKHVATLDMPQRNQVLKQMVDLSTDWSKAPSLDSLRSVCKNYAIGSDESGVDLSLLSAVAECDADTFIVSAAGIDLLSRLLEITTNVCEVSDTSGALLDVQSIAERLLRGFARPRDLPGFIERWFAVSHTCHSKGPCGNMSSHATVWSGERLRLMFSEMLERSMTPRQLVSVLDWLGGQSKNHAEAGLCILRAISDGVVSQPFADAVRMRLRDLAKGFMDGSDSVISTSGRIHYWAIVRRSIREADVTELDSLYKEIHHDLEELAGSCDPIAESVFYCACQLWACSYPDGALEATLCYTVCSYLDEVGQFAERIMSPESGPRWLIGHILQTVEWPLQEIPGFLS